MYLRALREKDIDFMYEWMLDNSINKFFRFDSNNVTKEKALMFIKESWDDIRNKHYAVTDENDEYLGTISLKQIDMINNNAEYAIVLRKKAIGTNTALKATYLLLDKAFYEFKLHKVYLNVLSENIRAIKFYKKAGFLCEGEFKEYLKLNEEYKNLKWFSICINEYQQLKLARGGGIRQKILGYILYIFYFIVSENFVIRKDIKL